FRTQLRGKEGQSESSGRQWQQLAREVPAGVGEDATKSQHGHRRSELDVHQAPRGSGRALSEWTILGRARPTLLSRALPTAAENSDVVALQRLHDEARHHAAVVGVHARAVRVEDAHDLDAQVVLTAVVEEQRLGAALAFVVAAALADRVDAAPVRLGLWVHLG